MSVMTTFRLADPFGVPLTEIANYAKADWVQNCAPGGVGVLELTLPLSFNTNFLLEDGRIGVWRAINGRPPYLDNNAIYQIRYLNYGPNDIVVRAYHANRLLERRIISYDAGSSFADKAAAPADDQIKAFVNENMLTGISGADRDGVQTYADVSAYLTKQVNLGLAPNIAKAAARRVLMDVAVDLANASNTAGTYLTFAIVAPTEGTLELRTYANLYGVDRRVGTANPVILSRLRGNLTNDHFIIDYTAAKTFVVAGGQGTQTERLIGTAFDSARAGNSPFGRNELFRDGSNVSTQAAVDDEADSGLRAARPVVYVTGNLIETPALTRGIDFDLGDMLTAEDPTSGAQLDVRLDIVHETIDSSGQPEQGFALTAHQVQPRRVLVGLRSVT